MTQENLTPKELRTMILTASKTFLIGLESGASYERLNSILLGIKENEAQLLKEEGTMLDPDIWRLLHNLLARGSNKEIIDTTADGPDGNPGRC
jgi:hypothetical protein